MSDEELDGPTLFEGIGTIDVEGVAHDVYLSAYIQGNETLIRWYGRFEWMGEQPKDFKPGGFFDLVFSDGRESKIRIPDYKDEDGKTRFLGQGLPPGFSPLYTNAVLPPEYFSAELRSTALPRWRVWSSRVLAVTAFGLMMGAIWAGDYQWKYLVTGLITSGVSIHMITPAKGRPLKEVKSDGDS